jgi:5-(carboxyamino)imidazole ribonucleotide synthase
VAKRVGIIGAGQLARMMIPPAINLGIDISILAETNQSSARLAVKEVGDYRDWGTVLKFSQSVDVVTFDHEHVPETILRGLESKGISVRPGSSALRVAQDKIKMRTALKEIGVPIPLWVEARSAGETASFLRKCGGGPIVAKVPIGGYDGRGVRVISRPSEIEDWLSLGAVLLEEKVPFQIEVAQLLARRPSGDIVTWPLVETLQTEGVCTEVLAPARVAREIIEETARVASAIADGLGVVGVLAVEMFVLDSGKVLINELAMRPHNSGHIFTEISETSQFEQHLRAVLDLPLGGTNFSAPFGAMVNVFGGVGSENLVEAMNLDNRLKVHDYSKSRRRGRKAGHVSIIGESPDLLLSAGRKAANLLASDRLA